jgi:hypothetical protein
VSERGGQGGVGGMWERDEMREEKTLREKLGKTHKKTWIRLQKKSCGDSSQQRHEQK